MATTQYQIFCRYLNENINRALTNQTKIDWVSAEEMEIVTEVYKTSKAQYDIIKAGIIAGTTKANELPSIQYAIYTQCKRYEDIQKQIIEGKAAIEYAYIRPDDGFVGGVTGTLKKEASLLDQEKYQIVIDESKASNPKYDMVFMYDGIANVTGEGMLHPPTTTTAGKPYLYYERMKRIKLDPWFLYSSHGSLASAMSRAKQLINILGKDAVKIGKVVSLDQYIEIV